MAKHGVHPQFDRTAKEALEKLLLPGGALHSLAVAPGKLGSLDIPLAAHLRPDRVTIYAGLTSLLEIKLAGTRLAVSAAESYARQPCALGLMGKFPLADAATIAARWPAYRDGVKVAERYLHREGILQARLIERYGLGFDQGDEWCIFDREAVIAYPSNARRDGYEATVKEGFRSVRCAIDADASIRTGKKASGDSGRELDLLAVTREGDLMVGEVKGAHDTAGIYLSPIQLAGYLQMWRDLADNASAKLMDSVNVMIEQRKRIGLLGRDAPRLRRGFRLLPALFIGEPKARSSAWQALYIVAGHLRAQQPHALEGLRIYALVTRDGRLEVSPRPVA